MRGKDKRKSDGKDGTRITPAYAGKSFKDNTTESLEEDHPRLCGEKRCSSCRGNGIGGSPPPMRGKD